MPSFQINKNRYPFLQCIQIVKKCYPKYLPLSCVKKILNLFTNNCLKRSMLTLGNKQLGFRVLLSRRFFHFRHKHEQWVIGHSADFLKSI